MNREVKAKTYSNITLKHYGNVNVLGFFVSDIKEYIEEAYIAGAKDAEENPAWRMCEDEVPSTNEDVFVAFDNGDRGIGYYEGIGEWYVNGIGCVDNIIAWLPLPVFNTKQETK